MAEDLAVLVYDYTDTFPSEERYGLSAQMRRAAISIGSNVFEGAGKQTRKGFIASLYISLSEANELLFQLRVAVRRAMGDHELAAKLRRDIERVRQMLFRLIRRLEAAAPRKVDHVASSERSERRTGSAATGLQRATASGQRERSEPP